VDGVQVDAVPAGDQVQRLVQVGAQLVGVARLAGVVAGGLDAAAGQADVVLEAPDVVALPAVQGNGDAAQHVQRPVGADAEAGVTVAGPLVASFNGGIAHGSPLAPTAVGRIFNPSGSRTDGLKIRPTAR